MGGGCINVGEEDEGKDGDVGGEDEIEEGEVGEEEDREVPAPR